MHTLRRIAEVRHIVHEWRSKQYRIGLVPTMGSLHEGHLSLVDHSRADCQRTIATLFVNPRQFAEGEDFDRYPRAEEADAAMLAARGCDVLFAPPVEEIYPTGAAPSAFATSVHVAGLSERLCGAFRTGHFIGSATVVMKLFMIAQAHAAYFGEKDYQQLQIIRRMTHELNVPMDIVGVPTVREPDGLAMSSRNVYLTPSERGIARHMYSTLCQTREALLRGLPIDLTLATAAGRLSDDGFNAVDYVSLVDPLSLLPVTRLVPEARLVAAAWLSRTRLIDNISAEPVLHAEIAGVGHGTAWRDHEQ